MSLGSTWEDNQSAPYLAYQPCSTLAWRPSKHWIFVDSSKSPNFTHPESDFAAPSGRTTQLSHRHQYSLDASCVCSGLNLEARLTIAQLDACSQAPIRPQRIASGLAFYRTWHTPNRKDFCSSLSRRKLLGVEFTSELIFLNGFFAFFLFAFSFFG
jgi:hypothetical protein